MENDNEQLSTAENVELTSEVEALPPTDESDTSEETETDEQKNARVQEEDAERRRVKEEKRQAGVQKRFDEITAEKYREKARADLLQEEIERLRNPVQKTEASGEPKREQFEEYEDYLRASAKFEAQQLVKEQMEQFQRTQKESATVSQMEQSRKEKEAKFIERRTAIEKEIPDYREVVEDADYNLPAHAVNLIVELEEGPLIGYHLAKNPALAAQFNGKSPEMQGFLMAQLVSTLKSAPKVSSAPAPGKPVSSSKASSSTEPPSDPEQYLAWAKKNMK